MWRGAPRAGRTYEVLLGVVPQVQQALRDGLAVLLPLARAEDHLREVPHPADYGDVGQLLLGQDLGALKQRGPGASVKGAWGPPRRPLEVSLGGVSAHSRHGDGSRACGGREPPTPVSCRSRSCEPCPTGQAARGPGSPRGGQAAGAVGNLWGPWGAASSSASSHR